MSNIGWVKLTKLPIKKLLTFGFSEAIQISANEYIVAPSTTYRKGIYKYQSNNRWKLFIKYPKGFVSSGHTLSYDDENGIIYLFSGKGQMAQININTKQFTIKKKLMKTGNYPSSIVVNSKVHIIGGSNSRAHLLWNPKIQTLKQVQQRTSSITLGISGPNSGLVHIRDKNILLLIGGTYSTTNMPEIRKYDFTTNEWTTVAKIPNVQKFGYVVVGNDQRYLVILGGGNANIIVIDLETMKQFKSTISCPISGNFRAILMDNSGRAAMIMMGFIRKYFEKYNSIPEDVFKLMVMWVISHEIHLLSENGGMHWRIDANEILDSVGVLLNSKGFTL